tara:strand:+ start:2642 stop:3244 length:603 start_codon:yes stop_codon:yes gene_type:complete
MKKSWVRGGYAATLMIVLLGCRETQEQRYLAYEKSELGKAVRYDSLFMGLHLKMSLKEFREYCFNKNIEGKFKQGGMKNYSWVEAKLKDTKYPMAITFYPNFKNDSISELNAAIYYDNAVFDDGAFELDSLLLEVLQLMDQWYGGPVFKIKSPFFYKEDVHVKVNGNRRITIYPDASGQMINLWYVDLTTLKRERHDNKE